MHQMQKGTMVNRGVTGHAITINTTNPADPPAWECICGAGTVYEWDGIPRARQHAEDHDIEFAPTFVDRMSQPA